MRIAPRIARFRELTLALGLIALLPAAPVAASGGLRTVALSGTSAPKVGAGLLFGGFPGLGAEINNRGKVMISSRLVGSGVNGSNDRALFGESGTSGLTLIAREGEQVPGIEPSVNFGLLTIPLANDQGQKVFTALLRGSGIGSFNNRGIFSDGGGNGIELVARTGSAAPETGAGVNFRGFNALVFNERGQTAFHGWLTGPDIDITNFTGIFKERARGGSSEGSGNRLALVARAGDSAPGTNADVNFSRFSNWMALNDAGQTAFLAFLTGTGVEDTNDRGIFSEGAGNGLALVAREGDAAPGMNDGVIFGDFPGAPALNNRGQTAFEAVLHGTGIDLTNNRGIFRGKGVGSLNLIAQAGDVAPGTGEGVNFGNFFKSLVLNGNGHTAFQSDLTGLGVVDANNRGIFSEGSGTGLSLVAREGDAAPGTDVFFNRFGSLVLNRQGQTAFSATLTTSTADIVASTGLFAEDLAGNVQLIAHTGDQLDVSDNPLEPDLRTISSVFFASRTGNEEGHLSGFNDQGQLAFSASFTDGSAGIFVSNLVAVPEPSTLSLFVLAGFAFGSLSRRSLKCSTPS